MDCMAFLYKVTQPYKHLMSKSYLQLTPKVYTICHGILKLKKVYFHKFTLENGCFYIVNVIMLKK